MNDDLQTVVDLQKHCQTLTSEQIAEELSQLTDPVFSARMMVKVTGLPMKAVLGAMGKTEKTGGRLNPETLPVILKLRDYGYVKEDVVWCLTEGTSQNLLSRLTGISQSRISRTWRKSGNGYSRGTRQVEDPQG